MDKALPPDGVTGRGMVAPYAWRAQKEIARETKDGPDATEPVLRASPTSGRVGPRPTGPATTARRHRKVGLEGHEAV